MGTAKKPVTITNEILQPYFPILLIFSITFTAAGSPRTARSRRPNARWRSTRGGLHLLVLHDRGHCSAVSFFGQRVNLCHNSGNAVLQSHALLWCQHGGGAKLLQPNHRILQVTGFIGRQCLLYLLSRRRACGSSGWFAWGCSLNRYHRFRGCRWRWLDCFSVGNRGGRLFEFARGVLFVTAPDEDRNECSQQTPFSIILIHGVKGRKVQRPLAVAGLHQRRFLIGTLTSA